MIQLNSLQKSILRDAGHPAIHVPIHPTKEKSYRGFHIVFSSVDTGQDILKKGNPCLVFFKHNQLEMSVYLTEIIIDKSGHLIMDFQHSKYDFSRTGVLITSEFDDYKTALKMIRLSIDNLLKSIRYCNKLKQYII